MVHLIITAAFGRRCIPPKAAQPRASTIVILMVMVVLWVPVMSDVDKVLGAVLSNVTIASEVSAARIAQLCDAVLVLGQFGLVGIYANLAGLRRQDRQGKKTVLALVFLQSVLLVAAASGITAVASGVVVQTLLDH